MKIRSKEDAFKILDKPTSRFPFEAIEYLMSLGKDEDILRKVIYNIENAYNESLFHDRENDYYFAPALWYCIVAESQIDQKLIDPIIKLYTTTAQDSDFLNEQGSYVLAMLCKEYGDVVIKKCLKTSIDLNEQGSNSPYLFLYDSLEFAEIEKYHNEILELLRNPEGIWTIALVGQMADSRYIDLLPRLQELKEYFSHKKNKTALDKSNLIELKESIKSIKNREINVDIRSTLYYHIRGDWKSHYKKFERRYVDSSEQEPIPETIQKNKKIGRNDPCPCGSGRKYKKCCL